MNFAKHLVPGALLAFATLQAAAAGELPTYDVSSFPATQHQLAVVGSSAANEHAPAATLTRDGMPATRLQLSVLAPHHHRSAELDTTSTVGAARN
jgi:hypothetical protein